MQKYDQELGSTCDNIIDYEFDGDKPTNKGRKKKYHEESRDLCRLEEEKYKAKKFQY